MFKLTNQMLDLALQNEPAELYAAFADTTFARHGYYGVMPRQARLLLAEAAVATARRFGIVSVEPVALFVQAMVDMSPRFWVFEPFKTILADSTLPEDRKMNQIMADDMAAAWGTVTDHLVAMEDWHLEHWDIMVDWPSGKVRA